MKKGEKMSEEQKQKISKAHKGKKMTDEHRKNLSNSHKGQIVWNKGLKGFKHSEESKLNMSKGQIGKKGNKSNAWRGGISDLYLKYDGEFTKELKNKIRKRDNYHCQLCNKSNEYERIHTKKVLSVHHVDLNPKNNKEENLITLCDSCHISLHNEERKNNINNYNMGER